MQQNSIKDESQNYKESKFSAKARFIRHSPYKLRPIADVIRQKKVSFALNCLNSCALPKAVVIKKLVHSVASNALDLENLKSDQLIISDIRVDEGATRKYFKPGARGRSNIYKSRSCHISIVLTKIKEA